MSGSRGDGLPCSYSSSSLPEAPRRPAPRPTRRGRPTTPTCRRSSRRTRSRSCRAPTGREFRYTHLVYNAGPGPLEIQPQYNRRLGQLPGHPAALHPQRRRTMVARVQRARAGRLRLPRRARPLPLPAGRLRPLRGRAPTAARRAGRRSRPRTASASTTPTSTTPPSCTPGPSSAPRAAAPTRRTLRGLSVGGADEYDYRDPGQAIPFDGVPDGTYWFRAMSRPQQRLRRGQRGQQRDRRQGDDRRQHGDRRAGPASRHDAARRSRGARRPTARASRGNVTLSASTPAAGGGGVQFLVDGNVVGLGRPRARTR